MGSPVGWTSLFFKELLHFNFNYEAFSLPSHPLHRNCKELNNRPPGFSPGTRHGSASLPREVRSESRVGSHAESVHHPVPAVLPAPPMVLRSRSLSLNVPSSRGRVLFACSTTSVLRELLLEPAPPAPPSLLPPSVARNAPSTDIDGAPTAQGSTLGRWKPLPGRHAALTSLCPSHLSGTRGPDSLGCVMESVRFFLAHRPTSFPGADS